MNVLVTGAFQLNSGGKLPGTRSLFMATNVPR